MQILKRLINSIARKLGVEIVRHPRIEAKTARLIERPFNVLAFLIEYYIAQGEPFYFIQVGANDGVRWDPLHALICKHHLQGLLVEPLPDIFEQLKKNYSTEPQLSFEACAVAAEDGMRTLYRVKSDAAVADWAHAIASFNRTHLIRHLAGEDYAEEMIDEMVEEVHVPTARVSTLLAKHGIGRISLLQIDTEGYDYEIVKMFLVDGRFPDIINFERVHLSTQDKLESRKVLAAHGYRFVDVGIDMLCVREDFSWPAGTRDVDVYDTVDPST